MESILKKIYKEKKEQAVQEIVESYQQKKTWIVHFLYFAPIVAQQIFELTLEERKKIFYKEKYPASRKLLHGKMQNATLATYKDSLLDADFVLPDGIALQLFYFVARLTKKIYLDESNHKYPFFLKNLNGTDFIPYFLEELKRQYWTQKICLLLYWAESEVTEKTKNYFSSKGFNVIFSQNGFSDLNRRLLEEELQKYDNTINIMLLARSTNQIPIQELRTYQERDLIEKNKLLVLTWWGLFEHITGFQKRSPKFLRILRLEWLRRLISDPKRNKEKVLQSLLVFKYIFSYLLLKKG